jgi:hypothetical protein
MIDFGGLLSAIGLPPEIDKVSNDAQLKSIHVDKSFGTQQVRFALPYGPYRFPAKYLTIGIYYVTNRATSKSSDMKSQLTSKFPR